MSSLGTRSYWLPLSGSGVAPKQIKKDQGYITVKLHTAHYFSDGNFWQDIFGGSDKITLKTQLTYFYGAQSIVAAAVQDVREVKANNGTFLAIQKFIALKVPSNADGLEMQLELAAIQNDNLDGAVSLLNSDEAKKPLELAPQVVGQVIAIAGLVKKAFTNIGPQMKLQSSYAGVISEDDLPNPVESQSLVEGYIIQIGQEKGGNANDADPTKLSLSADSLLYNGKSVNNTYVVYQVTVDKLRGLNPFAEWNVKFRSAYSMLDKILVAASDDEKKAIWNDSVKTYVEGSALLDSDPSYLDGERQGIKSTVLTKLVKRHQEVSGNVFEPLDIHKPLSLFVPSKAMLPEPDTSRDVSEVAFNAKTYLDKLAESNMAFDL